jgi:hypothetical protein
MIIYSPAEYWSAAETRHIDGIADGSRAPAFAVKIAALISAFATASCPDDPPDPMASSSACTRIDDKFKLKQILIHEIDYIKLFKANVS